MWQLFTKLSAPALVLILGHLIPTADCCYITKCRTKLFQRNTKNAGIGMEVLDRLLDKDIEPSSDPETLTMVTRDDSIADYRVR